MYIFEIILRMEWQSLLQENFTHVSQINLHLKGIPHLSADGSGVDVAVNAGHINHVLQIGFQVFAPLWTEIMIPTG